MNIHKNLILPIILLISVSCSHDPVYPLIGAIYISSEPTGVEILIDGRPISRLTPAKIDGIAVGWHTISLRYYRCKEWKQQVEVKPGQTRTLLVKMANIAPSIIQKYQLNSNGVDLAYDSERGRIYIANRSSPYLSELILGDSLIQSTNSLFIGSEQYAVTVSSKSNRGYALMAGDSLAVFELTSGMLLRKIPPGHPLGIKSMAFSFDGNQLYVANSADSSISIYHAGPDSFVRNIKLDGNPSEITCNPNGERVYVIFDQEKRLSMIEISGGNILASSATGNAPMGMFWDVDYQTMGLCNSVDKTVMLMNPENLSATLSPNNGYGTFVPSACFAGNNTYMWTIGSYYFIPEEPVFYGMLTLYYTPTWNVVGNYGLGIVPWDIIQTGDGRYLYILEKYSKDIVVFRTDLTY